MILLLTVSTGAGGIEPNPDGTFTITEDELRDWDEAERLVEELSIEIEILNLDLNYWKYEAETYKSLSSECEDLADIAKDELRSKNIRLWSYRVGIVLESVVLLFSLIKR